MEIKSISKKIFKTPKKIAENKSNQTNPFGVSFKGNIISADVFETTEKQNIAFRGVQLTAKVGSKCKMLAAALTGSIGDMSKAISTRLNSVVDFGRRIKGKFVEAIQYLNTTRLAINIGASDAPLGVRLSLKKKENLNNLSVQDLSNMFAKEVAIMEAA